jgi:hypothetical protein
LGTTATRNNYRICGSHSGGYEAFYLLGYNAVLTFTGLHAVTSQYTELFVTTILRISNPTKTFKFLGASRKLC